MIFYFNQFFQTWLLPPGFNIVLAILGLALIWRWPLLGKSLIFVSLLSLWLLSTPLIAQKLMDPLQYQYPSLSPKDIVSDKHSAIVVLEAGLNLQTPEYGKFTVSENTLTRLRYGAFLHQKTGAGVLVSGNDPSHPTINQADYMADALMEYFGIPAQWKEDRGFNTAEEGVYSAEILKKSGIKRIYLVTAAYHIPRSMYAFRNKGLEVIPAPTGYTAQNDSLGKVSRFLPTMDSLNKSYIALHEYIGLVWYKILYRA